MGEVVRLEPVRGSRPAHGASVRVKLTEDRITKLPLPSVGAAYTHDSEVPALAVRVTPGGTRSFVLVKKIAGRPHRVTLGRHPGLSLGEARRAARRILGEIAAGVDVVTEAKARRLRGVTLAEVWPDYVAHIRRKKRNRTWARDEQRWKQEIAPKIGKKVAAEVTTADLQRLVDRVGEKYPIAANRIAALLGAFMGFVARKHGLPTNPAKGLERFPENVRERFVRAEEMGVLLEAIRVEGEPWADLFELALWTGARRGAVLSMAWHDLDLQHGVWLIPASTAKNKKPAALPLTTPALIILKRRLTLRAGEAFVFPSTSRTGHVTTVAKAWKRILQRAGLHDLRIHDLRRSVGSWLAGGGASAFVIQRALTHASAASAKHYAHLDVTAVRAAMAQVAEAMQAAARLNRDDEES